MRTEALSGRRIHQLLFAALVLAARLGTASFDGSSSAENSVDLTSPNGDITLSSASRLPSALSPLGPGQAWVLPSGASVSGFGARRSGKYLLMTVNIADETSKGSTSGDLFGAASSGSATQTWVVDADTGLTHRYPLINKGWTETTVIGAGGWMLRKEVLQLPDDECQNSGAYDCYQWRLYAQPLDSGSPRILAESSRPGSQGYSPSLVTDGAEIAWEQADSANAYTLHLWKPGAKTATRVGERSTQGLLDFTSDGRLFVAETAPGATRTSTIYPHALDQILLPGQQDAAPTTTFTGLSYYSVSGGTVVYFPEPGDGHGEWRKLPLGSRTTKSNQGQAIKPGVDGAYSVEWITDSMLLSLSATGVTLYDLGDPSASATATSTDLTAPRAGEGYLEVGYSPSDGDSMIFSRKFG